MRTASARKACASGATASPAAAATALASAAAPAPRAGAGAVAPAAQDGRCSSGRCGARGRARSSPVRRPCTCALAPAAEEQGWPGARQSAAKAEARRKAGGPGARPAIVRCGAREARSSEELRRLGTLKSFSPAQGYGFIACDELYDQHQRDTYFDKSQLPENGWRFGMSVEFTCTFNARNQPQARNIDWDPIPHLGTAAEQAAAAASAAAAATTTTTPVAGAATAGASSSASAPAGGAPAPRVLGKRASERLRKLLKFLHEQQKESAVLSAIDFQGAKDPNSASGGDAEDGDRDLDYVTFVLDRLGPELEAVTAIKDFVKMLLLIMIAKMLQKTQQHLRVQQLVRWFEVLAQNIDVGGEVAVHIEDAVHRIWGFLQLAVKANENLATVQKNLKTAYSTLQAKAAKVGKAPATDTAGLSPSAH